MKFLKFFFSMLLNRNDGTLSSTKTFGVLMMTVSMVGFIASVFKFQNPEMMNESMLFGALGAALLGVKNVWAPK